MTNSAPLDAVPLDSRGVPCKLHETKKEVPPRARGLASSEAPRQDATETHRTVAVSAPLSAPPRFTVLVDGERFRSVSLVYGLVDPLEPERVRYVGKTTKGALVRYMGHLTSLDAHGRRRGSWLSGLLAEKRMPVMVLLERTNRYALDDCERAWIAAMQAIGQADCNAPAPKPETQAKRAKRRARMARSARPAHAQRVGDHS